MYRLVILFLTSRHPINMWRLVFFRISLVSKVLERAERPQIYAWTMVLRLYVFISSHPSFVNSGFHLDWCQKVFLEVPFMVNSPVQARAYSFPTTTKSNHEVYELYICEPHRSSNFLEVEHFISITVSVLSDIAVQ